MRPKTKLSCPDWIPCPIFLESLVTIDAVADLGSDLKSHSPSESVWYVFNKVFEDQLEGRNICLHSLGDCWESANKSNTVHGRNLTPGINYVVVFLSKNKSIADILLDAQKLITPSQAASRSKDGRISWKWPNKFMTSSQCRRWVKRNLLIFGITESTSLANLR